ncbi:MAG: hypothetical protein ACSLFM_02705 [Tepidiformaceae bacterium]
MSQATPSGVWARQRDLKMRCVTGCGRIATVISGSRRLCSACYTRERDHQVKPVS